MATYFHTVRVDGRINTFWTTLGDYRRIRAGNPQLPRFLIEAESIPEAEAIANALWSGGSVYMGKTRGTGSNAVCPMTGVVASESVTLADGAADQCLVPGVAPVPMSLRMIDEERARRDTRRNHAPLPSGGLWDDTAHRQTDMFG